MPEIISAKCFGCGHIVKVPAALGGKKARCPRCTNTISIPAQAEGGEEVVGDEMLPEVARDGEILEEEESVSASEPEESPPAERMRPPTGVRRGSSTSNPRAGGRAAQGGRGQQGRRGPAPAKSNTPLIVGVVVGVVVLIIAAVAMSKSGPAPVKPKSGASKQAEKEPANPEDGELERQCRGYIAAVNGGVDRTIMKYYSYDSDGERAVRRAVSALIEEGTKYENVEFKSSSAATGTVTFAYSGGKERTITWKKVDGTWLITEK